MTLGHDIDALDAIRRHEIKLRTGLPELSRRARISSKRDGYPPRASGAQPGTVTRPPELFTITATLLAHAWGWDCSCGTGNHVASWPTSASALEAAKRHLDGQHGAGSAIDYADPTGEAAGVEHKPDPVSRRHQRASSAIAKAERLMAAAVAQLAEPTNTDDNLAWCTACATIKHEDGRPYLTPPDTRVKGATTANGRLKEPTILCSWHRDWVDREGALPSRAITHEYVTRGRAPRKAS